MTDNLIAEAADRLMEEAATGAAVRRLEDRASASATWAALAESGFLDALVPEDKGGAGLTPEAILPVLFAAGRHGLPLPLGATIMAREALAGAGRQAPEGAIAIASSARREGPALVAAVPAGEFADHVLVPDGGAWLLLAADAAEVAPTGETTSSRMRWAAPAGVAVAGFDGLVAGAAVEVAEMAGAMEAMLAMTLRYANDRSQFGRPIGKFQAIQQQLAVMTELAHAALAAAGLAFAAPQENRAAAVAAAKVTIGEGAAEVTAIAHAVHGAIGMTEELDLHLLSERVRRGRLRYGSERFWARRLGAAVMAAKAPTMLDFVRTRIFA